MTKIAIIFVSLLALSSAKYPGKLFRENWGNKLMAYNLINMTLLMCKDAKMKLRMADHIQETYKNSLAYELGLLTSGINDKFKSLLGIYRFYTKKEDFQSNKHTFENVMNGYHVMQSIYNEIRAEIDLFFEVIQLQTKKKGVKDKELEAFAAKNPGVDLEKLKQAKEAGLIPPGALEEYAKKQKGRRSMSTFNETQIKTKSQNKTEWGQKGDPEEAEYKKKLRYMMWAERWKGFNPEIEGVHIENGLARAGLENASEFSLKEFEGMFI